MSRCLACLAPLWGFLLVSVGPSSATAQPEVERHVVVYGEDGEFAGWPANHGMWIWGEEILVGFSTGMHKDLGVNHNIDREKPEYHVLARSLDGGETWTMEYPNDRGMLINAGGMRHGTTDPRHKEAAPVPITEPIDFTHPDFCMTMRFQDVDGRTSRLYYSYDRGHNWKGPFELPSFGQPGVMARSDYLVNGPGDCHVFLTASKANEKEGRVFCGRTTDGGLTWKFLSYVGPEPNGFAIMPSTVRLSDSHLVMTTRRREGAGEEKHRWIDTWESHDNGESWTFVGNAVADVGEGNPPSMILLQDGRLCLTYGDRKAPWEIRAQFSSDAGHSWSEPFVLQTGGGGRDLGYPRTLQRPDGKIVTTYYFQTPDNIYRRIIATIWDPGTPEEQALRDVSCEGTYKHHLQGVCADVEAIYWSFTTTLVKTDRGGRLLKKVPVANHHGDLCLYDGKLYVAVNLGKFNDPQGNADSWVYVYDADTLDELARYETQEVFYGAGGIGVRGDRFFVVGGLPDGIEENFIYEYDDQFEFVKKHVLKSGHTLLGIQTAAFAHDRWWFGCYGDPKTLLVADADFNMQGRFEFDCSLGIDGLPDGRLLVAEGRCTKDSGCAGSVNVAIPDAAVGLRFLESDQQPDRNR